MFENCGPEVTAECMLDSFNSQALLVAIGEPAKRKTRLLQFFSQLCEAICDFEAYDGASSYLPFLGGVGFG